MEKIVYTKSQNAAIKKFHEFLKSDSQVFILRGYAGTGKTTLIRYFNSYLISINRDLSIMAPTGRAAKVVSDKVFSEAYTIHKTIYSLSGMQSLRETSNYSDSFKYYFNIRLNTDSSNAVYIVDESSMISNNYSDSMFFRFGSGHLLNDLLYYIDLLNPNSKRKVILVGDDAQLPPIGMDFSPALDKKYIEGVYNIKTVEYTLKDVVRQEKGSGILANATKIRQNMSDYNFSNFAINNSYKDVKKINYNDIVKNYNYLAKNDKAPIIIAHSNKSVHEYNNAIRKNLYPNTNEIIENDIILITKNNYKYGLLNGEFGKVKSIVSGTEVKNIFLKNDGGKEVKLYFKNIEIETNDISGQKIVLKCKIIENLLYSNQSFLTRDEQQALFVLFIMKMKKIGIKPNSPEFNEAIKSDPYFNALCIKYGYAVTCHKAQGGEWDNAIVDFNATLNRFSHKYYRWCYTALTRCSSNLFAIDNNQVFNISKYSYVNQFK